MRVQELVGAQTSSVQSQRPGMESNSQPEVLFQSIPGLFSQPDTLIINNVILTQQSSFCIFRLLQATFKCSYAVSPLGDRHALLCCLVYFIATVTSLHWLSS